MKVFLWKQKQLFEINRKEEIDANTYLISDYEEDMIEETLAGDGHLWLESNEIKWSGPKPGDEFDWDDAHNAWEVNMQRADEKLKTEQSSVWSNIKKLRDDALVADLYIESVDKFFNNDENSAILYNQFASMVTLGTFVPVQWKTADGTFIELTESLVSEIISARMVNTQRIFHEAEEHKIEMEKLTNPFEYNL